MKKFILLIMLLLPALAYAAPSLTFEAESHNFGKMKEGDKLEYVFEFTNTGSEDLRINKVSAS